MPKSTLGALVLSVLLILPAAPQDSKSKKEFESQVVARYAPVKLGPRGQNVVAPGTVLIVQVPGIIANPANQFTFMNSFDDGRIKHSKGSSLITDRKTTRELQVGEAVFLYKVEVKDQGVVFHVQPCGNCDFSQFDPMPFRAGLTFPFPKGWLASPNLGMVEQSAGRVFSFANAPPPPPAANEPAPAGPQSAPVRIELGQTLDQVVAALGQPAKIVDLGAKKIFIYKDLKVTFVDSKVTDVQ